MTWDFHPHDTIDDLACLNGQVYVGVGRATLTAMGTDIEYDDVIAIGHDTEAGKTRLLLHPSHVDAIIVALAHASTAAKMGRAS